MFDAMVLAAGFGTRLRPITDEIPKPLLPVGHRPLLERILRKLHEGRARKLVLNAHHRASEIAAITKSWDLDVEVILEPEIRGTAGGIAGARHLFTQESVIVVNGDIFGDLPLSSLLASASAGLTLAVAPRGVGSGTVGLGRSDGVVRLRGETFGDELAGGDYTGIAKLGRRALATLPERGCLVGDWALPELRQGNVVDGARVPTSFVDIGTPAAYLRANLDWARENPAEAIHPEAEVTPDVEVVDSVLGAGVKVTGHGSVERVVALAGAALRAPMADAIVLPSGRVVGVS